MNSRKGILSNSFVDLLFEIIVGGCDDFFSFLSNILYFETIFDYDNTMQDINNWLGYSLLIGSAYKILIDRGRTSFRLTYFQGVS